MHCICSAQITFILFYENLQQIGIQKNNLPYSFYYLQGPIVFVLKQGNKYHNPDNILTQNNVNFIFQCGLLISKSNLGQEQQLSVTPLIN